MHIKRYVEIILGRTGRGHKAKKAVSKAMREKAEEALT